MKNFKRRVALAAASLVVLGSAVVASPAQAAPITAPQFGPSANIQVTGWVWGCRRPWYLFGGETCGIYWKW